MNTVRLRAEHFALAIEVEILQKALAFWLPHRPATELPKDLEERLEHDIGLLAGYMGKIEEDAEASASISNSLRLRMNAMRVSLIYGSRAASAASCVPTAHRKASSRQRAACPARGDFQTMEPRYRNNAVLGVETR
jgi:hypothetical protein